PALSASRPHTQADHAVRTGSGIGNTRRLARHLFIRRPPVHGPREPPHQTSHRPGGRPRGRKVLRWPPLPEVLRAHRAPAAGGSGIGLRLPAPPPHSIGAL